ncbi:MAG: hypothetical protein IPJ75_15745 [Ignavibacteriales bacterium]|nr:hypothetical protein [Ignavibacteriales bacterium]
MTTNGGISWLGVYWLDDVFVPEFLSVTDSNKIFLATNYEIFVTDNLGGQPGTKEDVGWCLTRENSSLSNCQILFNPSTRIGYYLPESGIVKPAVYNIMGELLISQQPEFVHQGHHIIKFDGSHLPFRCLYLKCHLWQSEKSIKMLLLK